MSIKQLFYLLAWDFKINHGWSFDCIRVKFLLIEIRIEQYIYQNCFKKGSLLVFNWYVSRFIGSIFQWFLCNSNIPGSVTIGRGLRLPHPQNIIIAAFAEIGEFCTIYQNVTIAWNGFVRVKPLSPCIGNNVLIGTGSIIIGDITIGSDVLIGAGTVVYRSITANSRVTSSELVVSEWHSTENAATPGSERHIRDPYSIWR